jgi:alanine racemase
VLAFEQAYLDGVRPGIMLYGYSPLSRNPDITLPANNSSHPSTKGVDRGVFYPYQTSDAPHISLIPAMTVKARILCIRKVSAGTPISYGRTFVTKRPSRIGVIAIGYADGYSRLFSNSAHVLAKGQRVPVVGRVCMDLTMVDLTDTDSMIEEGDEVIIIGRQGNERITADELAGKANTVSYEILTSLGRRSTRRYVETH